MQPKWTVTIGLGLLIAALAMSGSPVRADGGSLRDVIRRNDVSAATLMIGRGADVKAADETGATPLMFAAFYAGPDIIGALLEKGADVNAENKFGASALMWAAPHTKNVKLLLDHAADVNARASNGTTAIVAAARYGNVEAVTLLLAAGADTKSPENRRNLLTSA